MSNFQLKRTYNFSILSEVSSILGLDYKLMKVKALLSSEEAVKYADIATQHETVKPFLSNISDSVSDLTYILFTNQDGTETVFALEYIDIGTITEVKGVNIRVNIMSASTEDINLVKTTMKELGFTNFNVTTFE